MDTEACTRRHSTGCVDSKQLPALLKPDYLDYYTNEYSRTGFRGGLNWYRGQDISGRRRRSNTAGAQDFGGSPPTRAPSERQRSGGAGHGNRPKSHAVAPQLARPARGSQGAGTNNNIDDVGFVGFLLWTS
jgi:hypothetical protein